MAARGVRERGGTRAGSAGDACARWRRQEMPAARARVAQCHDAPRVRARGDARRRRRKLETLILARLQASPEQAGEEARRAEVQNLIAGVDGLLRDEKAILKDTGGAAPRRRDKLSERQDQLADQSVKVRKDVENSAGNSSLGDPALARGLEEDRGDVRRIQNLRGDARRRRTRWARKAFPKAAGAGNGRSWRICRKWSTCSAPGNWPRPGPGPTKCAKRPRI